MQFFSLSDKGMCRKNNEDHCDAKNVGNFTLLVLADGMGGANSGEVASEKAVSEVFRYLNEDFLRNLNAPDIPKALAQVVDKANSVLFNLAQSDPALKGMGTTLEICLISENSAYIAHIGDSRVYKITPGGEITRLTKDHSLVEYMIEAGTITPEEAFNHPQRNVITKALGTAPEAEPDIFIRSLEEDDIILLCSDGLSNMLPEKEIADVVLEGTPLSERTEKLIQLANEAGGNDNITVVIAQN